MKTFHIITFGCQMNEYDSAVIKEMLKENGFVYTDSPDAANIVIVNGCVVREKPEKKEIELLKYYKKRGKFVVAAGCLAQKDKKALLEFSDLVVGPMEYDNLPEIIKRPGVFTDYNKERDKFYEYARKRDEVGFSEYVTIMTGCDNFCSYCVVPFTRGREKSRPPWDIIDEVKGLIAKGTKEITLIGQNVNSYFYEGVDFKDLLQMISKLNVKRIRFTTSHPRDISLAVFDIMAKRDNIMPHIHLPVQTGSNKLLKEMRRGYTREEYIYIVNTARKIIPDIVISADIMVGYPTETEEDFLSTLDLVKRVQFDYAYMFIYSPRKPSIAYYRYKEQLPKEVAVRRHRRLVETVQQIVIKKRKDMIGKTYEVMIDGHAKKNEGLSRGKTRGNITVVVEKHIPEGEFVKVKITHVNGTTPIGKPIKT